MTLIERIETDRDTARREGRRDDAAFYSYLIAEARKPGKTAGNRDSTDDEIVGVVQKLMRQNDETLAAASGQGEERLRRQNKIMTGYMPNQMDEAVLRETIKQIIADSGQPASKRLLGYVMKTLKETHAGEYAPALASQITGEFLEPREG
jgi:uncharacterized protein YqeY